MSIALVISSFFAGVLTILAPCVLPLLPVIIGSSVGSKNPRKPFVVVASLAASIVLFTLLLKASTVFINVPQSFWNVVSGGIVLIFGLFLLFPDIWDIIAVKLGLSRASSSWLQKGTGKDSLLSSVIIGVALGPVFSSCSPTYFIILATVLPVSFLSGVIYLIIYAAGLAAIFGLIAYFGQKIIIKLRWAANPNGLLKKILGVLLVLVGLAVLSGYYKTVEANLIKAGYDAGGWEQKLLGTPKFPQEDAAMTPPAAQEAPIMAMDAEAVPMENMTMTTSSPQNITTEKYQDYSEQKVMQAREKGYNYALFFHAGWCPSCISLEQSILNNVAALPQKSVIFKVDYDSETKLKKDFNVLSQTTVLFFDAKGNLIDRKINPTIERIAQGLLGQITSTVKLYQSTDEKSYVKELQYKKSSFASAKDYFAFLEKEKSLKRAMFAGGCFWCLEGPFEAEDGVVEGFSGYGGGSVVNPSYEEVSSGRTGAREVLDVFYDPKTVSYEKLLEIYWRQIDPADDGGQFADRGSQYTTAVYYRDDEQKTKAEQSKEALKKSGKFSRIATEILPFESFYLAEEYHQDYYKKSDKAYLRYKAGSGRASGIKKNAGKFDEIFAADMMGNSAAAASAAYTKPAASEIKTKLSKEAYEVTQKGGTERPFHNAYWDNKEPGIYVDVVTGEPLFSSTDKYDSGTGWPSFTRPIDDNFITEETDNKLFMTRTEVKSKVGDSHLGHVFNDGPEEKGGLRYCINSAALRFIPVKKLKESGYEKYLPLFDDKLKQGDK